MDIFKGRLRNMINNSFTHDDFLTEVVVEMYNNDWNYEKNKQQCISVAVTTTSVRQLKTRALRKKLKYVLMRGEICKQDW